ncbi:hypothetical protein HII36_38575 [Nonomuraea sp. NN258]|uniref:hypothetical protein n=1 Tax=Nonomuraea antri TaxID=2730852 RepID=UPI001568A2FB|nr:hypothetical protein [Nonomuraea antri]NRQ37694.1 hypothetical protein [Nonomuraea antri]
MRRSIAGLFTLGAVLSSVLVLGGAQTALGVTGAAASVQDPEPAAAAAAAPDACTAYGCYTGDGWGSGFGRWMADGDKMWVCDRSADGWSIVVVADIGTRAYPNKWHTGGAGKCTERSYGDVGEGQRIYFHTCLGDYSTNTIRPGSCGPVSSGTT